MYLRHNFEVELPPWNYYGLNMILSLIKNVLEIKNNLFNIKNVTVYLVRSLQLMGYWHKSEPPSAGREIMKIIWFKSCG